MPTLFSSTNLQLPFVRPESSGGPGSSRGRFENVRGQVSNIFSGQSVIRPQSSDDGRTPKPPAPRIGVQVLSRSSEGEPAMDRSAHPMRRSPSSTHSVIDSSSPVSTIRPLTPSAFERLERSATSRPSRPRPPRSRTFPETGSLRRGTSPEDLELVNMIDRRRRHSAPNKTSKAGLRRCTLSNVKKPRVRAKAVSCLVSGLLLAIVLAIYLALAISNPTAGQEFHVLLILIILMMTIFFCHSLIRLWMLILHPEREERRSRPTVDRLITGGYANPEQPIHVTLARDEELARDTQGEDQGKTTLLPPPPAYGLWRNSVRMNPNMVYWQKVESPPRTRNTIPEREVVECDRSNERRPPSYASDDGVGYVIEAQPRSTVADNLPVHPSERGRVGSIPLR